MSFTVYVGNLPFKISDDDLKAHFSSAGNVIGVTHIRDRASGRSNGCGFVEMENNVAKNSAVEKLNGSELEGRTITVVLARPD
tara:strand:- start:409 stop:657 length:249 start_codon:yes stop_codon:yes gene_type:complete